MNGLHSLSPARGSRKRKKRLGRGHGSGHGTYSGRGVKGQRARAGGRRGITARAMKAYLLRIPKRRGFTAEQTLVEVVSLATLEAQFQDGAIVSPKVLRHAGIIKSAKSLVKILAGGALVKKLKVKAHAFSKGAEESILKAGGTVERISMPEAGKKKQSRT